jgi:hypothetical protein
VDDDGDNVRVWAKQWSEIVNDCEKRLQYYEECLDHDPAGANTKEYVNRKYGDLIPDILKVEGS